MRYKAATVKNQNAIVMQKSARRLALLAAMLMLSAGTFATPVQVVGVLDGDTVDVLTADKRQARCRLYGVDAPEKAQPFGMQSKKSLSDLVYGKTIDVQVTDTDRYGRSICRLSVNGVDVNREQVARGYAWMYRQYARDASYAQAEYDARQSRRGLWADSQAPIPPWDWRKQMKAH